MRAGEFIVESRTKEFGGIEFKITPLDAAQSEHEGFIVTALDPNWGRELGYVVFADMGNDELDPRDLSVDERYQGQGIAKTMYDYVKSLGYTIHRSSDQTPAGKGFWNKHRGEKTIWEDAENYNGIDISLEIQKDDEYVDDEDTENQVVFVKATSNGKDLGYVVFSIQQDSQGSYLHPQDLEVEERYRGQGIAQTMYDFVKSKGYRIRRSGQQTDAGAGFWAKHRPEQNVWEEANVEENFADGKHPGRKGLAKRVGVNCKQPVSKLRSIAAHSSGEKQRMAHWCANMKAGKK